MKYVSEKNEEDENSIVNNNKYINKQTKRQIINKTINMESSSQGTSPKIPKCTNHSVEFVAHRVHTQNMESYWNRIKTKLKRMRGRGFAVVMGG